MTDTEIGGVDTRGLLRSIRPNDRVLAPRDYRFGLSYPVETEARRQHSFSIGVLPNADTAHLAFTGLENSSQASPADSELEIGDEHAYWPAEEIDPLGGAILFRRSNAVVYLTGDFESSDREDFARKLDRALTRAEGPVYKGPPNVPEILLRETPERFFSSKEDGFAEMDFDVRYDGLEPGRIRLYTPDELTARIVIQPSTEPSGMIHATFQFYRSPAGTREYTIVALSDINVVGSRRFSVDFV